MITNIVEIVDVLPKVTSPGIRSSTEWPTKSASHWCWIRKLLRKSETMRSDAAKAAADIAQRMAAYMGVPAITEVA